MNQPPNITDRVLWVAVPKEIRNNTGRLVTHAGSCECGAHAHANPYHEADGTYTCPVLRTPLPLNGLSKYTPPGKITEGWPVQVDSNVAHYIGKANEMGLQGMQISPIEVSERTRGIVNVTYSHAEDEAIAAWKSRVAAVEKSESEHVKYELPRIGRSAEYSVKSHDEAIERRSKQRAAAQARLDVYRKAHAYYTQGQAPEKTTAKEPSVAGVVYFTTFSQLNNGQKFKWNDPSQSYLSELGECIKFTDRHFKRADGKLSNTAVKADTPVLVEVRPVTEEKEPPRHAKSKPFDQLPINSTFIFDNPLRGRATACTKVGPDAYTVGNDPMHMAMLEPKREVIVLQEAEPRPFSHIEQSLACLLLNPNLDAPVVLANTLKGDRQTFAQIKIGTPFRYCAPERNYSPVEGSSTWVKISETQAKTLNLLFNSHTAPLVFDPTDIVEVMTKENEATKPEEPAQEPTQAPYHKMVSVRLDGDTIARQADAQSYRAEGLVKVHNRDTLSKFAPDDTRRTFGDVPIGAFFYYCSPEINYNVAPGATAWQRISHTEALPVAFIHRTDEDALKITPTKFGQGDIVAGVKVRE